MREGPYLGSRRKVRPSQETIRKITDETEIRPPLTADAMIVGSGIWLGCLHLWQRKYLQIVSFNDKHKVLTFFDGPRR